MTTSVDTKVATHAENEVHFSDAQYIKVALFLAVVTAIEVALSYVDVGAAGNPSLLILAAIKFVTVALYFMHLKWDNRILRRLFFSGLILAVFCYVIVLLMFHVF